VKYGATILSKACGDFINLKNESQVVRRDTGLPKESDSPITQSALAALINTGIWCNSKSSFFFTLFPYPSSFWFSPPPQHHFCSSHSRHCSGLTLSAAIKGPWDRVNLHLRKMLEFLLIKQGNCLAEASETMTHLGTSSAHGTWRPPGWWMPG